MNKCLLQEFSIYSDYSWSHVTELCKVDPQWGWGTLCHSSSLYPEVDERKLSGITPVEREENRLGRERLGTEVLLYIVQGLWAVTGMSFMGILS